MSRFEMWAGQETREGLEFLCDILQGKKTEKPAVQTVWPIVDNKTCGPINGMPRPEQYLCVCWTPQAQRLVYEALNAMEEKT